MANSLKGNLGLKSSPLAPTSSKLTTQYIVLDHMTNHFKKINTAKSAIDNKPPKCLVTSQKMRDRRNRTRIMKSPLSRPDYSMRDDELEQQYQDILNEEPEDEEDRLVHSIMRSALTDKPSNYATYGSRSDNTQPTDQVRHSMTHPVYNGDSVYRNRPSSARSYQSVQSARSVTSRTPVTHDLNRVTYKGDVLQTRSHRFTEAGPFTPRTNKSKAESKLKNSSCYNPPRPRSGQAKVKVEAEHRPRAAPRGSRKSEEVTPAHSDHNFHEGLDTAQLSETMLMDMSLRSRDDHRENVDHEIPRLDISMDRDHINWLQEQANKAQVRAKSGAKLPMAEEAIPEESSSLSQSGDLSRSLKMEAMKKPESSSSLWSVTSCTSCSSWFAVRLMEEEEEQKYLAFAQEVTDDVLARGISSERVMQRIFESHIEKRQHDLDETRMRKVIRDLRTDLGLKDHISEHGSVGSQRNNNSTASLRPGSSEKSSHTGSVHKTGSEKSVPMEDSHEMMNGHLGDSLQEQDMGSTLESTSTMKFAGTRDMFSTINSEASREAREEALMEEDGELSTTQALKQYHMTLTAKEEGIEEVSESGHETTVANSVGGDTMSEKSSHKLERPATGERRTEDDQKSDASTIKGSQNGSSAGPSKTRSRRRERQRKNKGTDELSSNNSHPASSVTQEDHNGQSEDALSNSQKTATGLTNGEGGGGGSSEHLAQKELNTPEATEDAESVVSSTSSRPIAKPRSSARSKAEPSPPAGERGSVAKDQKVIESTEASSHNKPEKDDLMKETSESAKQSQDEEMEDDYEDDYEADEDDGQEVSTHRTSDDDF